MNFRDKLSCMIRSRMMAGRSATMDDIFENIYEYPDENSLRPDSGTDIAYLLAGGPYEARRPFDIRTSESGEFILISCGRGELQISSGAEAVNLSPGMFIILSLKNRYTITASLLPCSGSIYVMGGSGLSAYANVLDRFRFRPAESGSLAVLTSLTDELAGFGRYLSDSDTLMVNGIINYLMSIETAAFLSSMKPNNDSIDMPVYLKKMRRMITTDYAMPFSLALCENELNINRYRLCREYKEAFHCSPLKDLNRHRLAEAKRLLFVTDMQIQEISSTVGYENVTHFINLFKQEFDVTPGEYRNKVRKAAEAAFPNKN